MRKIEAPRINRHYKHQLKSAVALSGGRRRTKPQHHHRYQFFKKAVFWICIFCIFFWWFRGWNGREPVNFVVVADNRLYLLAIRPAQKHLTEIEIPANALIKTNEGQWQAWALAGLSKIQKSSQPLKSVGWDLLEIPVDKVIYLPSWPKGGSLFSISENFRLMRFVNSLNDNQITKINLSTLSTVRKTVDPDGVELLEIDTAQLSSQISVWATIDEIRQEGLAVSIENTSGKTGAGNRLARALEHTGLNVVGVGNGQDKKSLLVSSKKLLRTLTVKKLSRWLNLKPQVQSFDNRADILIIY